MLAHRFYSLFYVQFLFQCPFPVSQLILGSLNFAVTSTRYPIDGRLGMDRFYLPNIFVGWHKTCRRTHFLPSTPSAGAATGRPRAVNVRRSMLAWSIRIARGCADDTRARGARTSTEGDHGRRRGREARGVDGVDERTRRGVRVETDVETVGSQSGAGSREKSRRDARVGVSRCVGRSGAAMVMRRWARGD